MQRSGHVHAHATGDCSCPRVARETWSVFSVTTWGDRTGEAVSMTGPFALITDNVPVQIFNWLRRYQLSPFQGRADDYQEVSACAPGPLLVCNTLHMS